MAMVRVFLIPATGISCSLGPTRMVMGGIFPGMVLSAEKRVMKKRLPKMIPERSRAQKYVQKIDRMLGGDAMSPSTRLLARELLQDRLG